MRQARRAFVFQFVTLAVGVVLLFAASRALPLTDWIATIQEHVMHWGVWSAVCYPFFYAACNVLLLPGGVLSIGGGFFFGLWWGFLIVLVGNMVGAAISFLISRAIGERWLRRRLMRNATIEALAPAVEREGWKIILLSQLNPLFPSSLMNYLYGLTTMRFRTCMIWIAIGQAPGLFFYAYLGTLGQLGLNLFRGKTHPRLVEYAIWGGGLVLSLGVVILLGGIALRILQEAERAAKTKTAAAASISASSLTAK